jgi:hypothetical protein
MSEMAHSWQRLVVIWAVMCALTLASLAAGKTNLPGNLSLIFVIVAALIKVRFVVLDFMEVRTAPIQLRLVLEGWLIALGAALLAVFP